MGLRLVAAFLISLFVTVAVGSFLVPMLRRLKVGQTIREEGPKWHEKKQGTTTMGGIMFIAGVLAACLTVGFDEIRGGELTHIIVLMPALGYAAIGFLDDYQKIRNRRNLGLTAIQKFALQLAVAIIFLALMRLSGNLSTDIYIPFFNVSFYVPPAVYFLFAAFVMVGTVNGTNLTDGIDGLLTGVSVPVGVFFTVAAFIWGAATLGVIAAALTGALCAFLIFNFHPAKVFMGDTGSLFIGGAVSALAFAMDMPLILAIVGLVYIVEALSVMIQVTYFKRTKGKRVFKMAPIHHHFEMCGWNEYKLFTVFTSVSAILAALAYLGVCGRFK